MIAGQSVAHGEERRYDANELFELEFAELIDSIVEREADGARSFCILQILSGDYIELEKDLRP